MKKWLVSMISIVAVTTLLGGCSPEEQAETKKAKSHDQLVTIKLGVMPSTDNIPFIIAHEQGFDKENGVNIELEVFKSGPDRDAAFQAGKLDGVITDLVGVAIYQEGGLDARIVAAPHDQFDLVTGDDEVQTIADLKGKEVIFSERTGTAYAVAMMLEEAGLTMADIVPTEVPQVPARLELLTNKQASGAILPEPFVTMAEASGLRVVQSTLDIGINPFAIAMSAAVITEKEAAIKGMFEAYNEATTYVKDNDKEAYIDLFIEEVGFPDSLKEQIVIPDYNKIAQVKESDVTAAFAWSQKAGLLTKDLTMKDVVSDVYFK